MSGNGFEYKNRQIEAIKDELFNLSIPKSLQINPVEFTDDLKLTIELELFRAENGDLESVERLNEIINKLKLEQNENRN
jgi:hypothetical protein